MVDDAVMENPAGVTFDLFHSSSLVSGLEETEFMLTNEDGTVKKEVSVSAADDNSVIISGAAVAEPSSATLSLLALADWQAADVARKREH